MYLHIMHIWYYGYRHLMLLFYKKNTKCDFDKIQNAGYVKTKNVCTDYLQFIK
jgi:hypothetical protein